MKKFILLPILILLFASVSYAETWDTGTQRDSGSGNHHHHVDIPERENPLGYGLDIEHDFNKNLGIKLEFRDDIKNNEKTGYIVGKIKI